RQYYPYLIFSSIIDFFLFLFRRSIFSFVVGLQCSVGSKLAVQTDHEAMTNMKTEFMVLWDGFFTDPNVRVMVLAATNRPSELDEAILRRLPQTFEIGMPDCKDKAEILKDIFELCKKAAYFPIRETLEEEGKGRPCPKTQVAAGEYCGLRRSREPDEVEAAISGISKLLDGDIRSIKTFEILKLLNLNSKSSEVVHVHSKP
ncbi:hypothetical protein HID58_080056, partial [Brassica napus]